MEHILNSRTLDFAEGVMEITGGKGVDVVLNSLAGDFFQKTRRTNSGTAMTDSLPASSTTGLVNGTRIDIAVPLSGGGL